MSRSNQTVEIGDFLKNKLQLDPTEINSAVDAARAIRRINPSFRFNMEPKEAFMRLLKVYQAEVQSRNRVFTADENTLKVIAQVAQQMTEPIPKSGVILLGSQGNGKTTLAKAILKLIRSLNSAGHFSFMGEYFTLNSRLITSTEICELAKVENYEAIRNLKNMTVLVIDDLGEEPKEVMVYGTPTYPVREIIEARYDAMRFTVITTNLTATDIPTHYGWRITDRFREMYHQIAHTGPSYR